MVGALVGAEVGLVVGALVGAAVGAGVDEDVVAAAKKMPIMRVPKLVQKMKPCKNSHQKLSPVAHKTNPKQKTGNKSPISRVVFNFGIGYPF